MVDIALLKAEAQREEERRQRETALISSWTQDFIVGVRLGWLMSTRHTPINRESLTFRLTDDLLMSAIAADSNLHGGALNPVRRELRYMLEQAIKYAHVDLALPQGSLEQRVEYLRRRDVDLVAAARSVPLTLDEPDRVVLLREIGPLYGRLSEYAHPSVAQLTERLEAFSSGSFIGRERPADVAKLGELAIQVYDIALVYYLHALGFSLTGDLILEGLEDRVGWTFHHTPHMAALSRVYNYKHERQGGKAGPVHSRVSDLFSWLDTLLKSKRPGR